MDQCTRAYDSAGIQPEGDPSESEGQRARSALIVHKSRPCSLGAATRRAASLPEALLDLYGGRHDAVARGYHSARAGHGWMPACRNQWAPDVCGLVGGRWRCGECTSHAPVALTPSVLQLHVVGEGALTTRDRATDPVWLGAYLVDEQGRAKVGVYDIDNHSGAGHPHTYLCAMRDALADRDLLDHAAIFRSRRGRGPEGGYHVVISLAEAQPEAWVRAVLTALARATDLLPPPAQQLDGLGGHDREHALEQWLNEHGAMASEYYSRFGSLDIEIFPKSSSTDSPYGYLIALPCGGHWERQTGGGIPVERDTLAETTRNYIDYLSEVIPLETSRFLELAAELGVDLTSPEVKTPKSQKIARTAAAMTSSVTITDRAELEPLFAGCIVMRSWRDRQLAGERLTRAEWWPGAVLLARGCGAAGRELTLELDQSLYGDKGQAETQIAGWRATGLPTCRGSFTCSVGCFDDERASPVRHLLRRSSTTDHTHTPTARKLVTPERAKKRLLNDVIEFLAAEAKNEAAVFAAEAGAGKSTAVRKALAQRAKANARIVKGRVLPLAGSKPRDHRAVVLVPTHDLADEWEARGRDEGLDIQRLPQLVEAACIAGKYDEIEEAGKAGYDRTAAVCSKCDHYPAARQPVRPCPYFEGIKAVADSGCDVLVAVRAYHRYSDFYDWAGNESRPTVIYDEDPLPDVLHRANATAESLRAFADVLAVARDQAQPSAEVLAHWLHLLAPGLADLAENARGSRALTLDDVREAAGAPVPDWPEFSSETAAELSDLLAAAWAEEAVERTPNHLPLLLALGRALVAGEQPLAMISKDSVRVIVRHPLPEGRRIALLDATASTEFLETALRRPVAVRADFALAHGSRVIHYIGRNFSIDALKTAEARQQLADVITRLIERHPAAKVGVITYRALLKGADADGASILDAQIIQLLPPDIQSQVSAVAHFGALRGTNALEDLDVLVVAGTYRPPSDEIRLTALALGASAEQVAEEGKLLTTAYHGHTLRGFNWRGKWMKLAHEYHVRAELMQAVARNRYTRATGKYVYVLAGEPLDIPGIEVRSIADEGLLEDAAAVTRARAAAVALLDAGGLTLALLENRLGAQHRQATRLYADVQAWLGDRVRREGARRGRLVWAPPGSPASTSPAAPAPSTVNLTNLEMFPL